ncbi:hypothetical protein D3C84_395210 [compost metagenome]
MNVANIANKELPWRDVLAFFVLAAFMYILPLILADYYYIDDNWRSLSAGTAWAEQGRWVAELFYRGLTFSSGAPHVFPLPLLIAVIAIALAMTRLTFHYYPRPTLSCCLVVLPLWYNPFFLQNLSYQYDGPTMALSLVAMVYAITFSAKSVLWRVLVPGVLVSLGMGLYQLSINVFLGLCCIELVRAASEGRSWQDIRGLCLMKGAQLICAVFFYSVTTHQSIIAERLPMQSLSANGLAQVGVNIDTVAGKVALLFEGGNRGWLWVVLLCAALGAVQVAVALCKRPDRLWRKVCLGLLCLLTLPLLLLLVCGVTLLFRDFNEGARTLLGFGVLWVFVYYLSRRGLEAVDARLGLLLAIPLLSLLVLSFAYGRVLTVQKEFATSALFSLGHDIASNRPLREAKRIYMAINYSDRWLAKASGSFKVMPVLAYILNVDFYMLAENLPRVGINNVFPEKERRNATLVGYQGFAPLVDSQFYNLYLVGDYGFIVMKEPPRP